MKATKLIVGGLSLGLVTSFTLPYAMGKGGSQAGGTSILHFMANYTMTNGGIESNATGTVQVKMNKQGNANNQNLNIRLANLTSNTVYHLQAKTGSDTNLIQVVDFTTSANGGASLAYVFKGQGNAAPHGTPMPDALKPVSSIRELDIVNISTQTVLTADFTDPTKLQYLIKRNLDTNGVDTVVPGATAALRIKATVSSVQFLLSARGLSASNTYYLAINDAIAKSVVTDGNGAFKLTALPVGSPAILDITSLEILDATSNSVLETSLP